MKSNPLKEYLKICKAIVEHSHNKKWECIEPGCSNQAINSHLLQRHGILSNVVEDGHIYEVRCGDIMKWDEHRKIVFDYKKVGLQRAISVPLFCNEHDTSLFYDIEHCNVDYNNYRVQLLFSYRAVCAEIRKKQIALDINDRMLKSSILNMSKDQFAEQNLGLCYGIKDLEVYRSEIKSELHSPSGMFVFHHFTYPKLGIYTSSTFSYDDKESVKYEDENEVLNSGFIHIIPLENSTEIIVGYNKNRTNSRLCEYALSWGNLSNDELGNKLTNLFVFYIEAWGMSPSLFKKINTKTRERFQNCLFENIENYGIEQDAGFNLFAECFDIADE